MVYKIWLFLNGKKSAIGATLNAVALWMAANGILKQDDLVLVATILTVWTGLSVGHKVVKGGAK